MRFRLAAHPPAHGEIKIFDIMVESGMSKKEALLALMRKGTSYLDQVGLVTAICEKDALYKRDVGNAIETNRIVDVSVWKKLKQRFDPFDVLTTRALGVRVGEAVIMIAVREL